MVSIDTATSREGILKLFRHMKASLLGIDSSKGQIESERAIQAKELLSKSGAPDYLFSKPIGIDRNH